MHYPKEIANLTVDMGELIINIRRGSVEECVLDFDTCYPGMIVKLKLDSCRRFSLAMADFLERLEDIIKGMSLERRRNFAAFLEQDFKMAKADRFKEEVPF